MSVDLKRSRDENGDTAQAETLNDLRKCQKEIISFRHKCDRQIDEIEKSYAQNVRPFMERRNSLIQNIPRFWSKSIVNHPLISTVFEPGESDVLNYLTNLDIDENEKHSDYFRIHFSFRKNPYFENKILTKEFTEHGSINTAVRWKKGQQFPKVTRHELWKDDDLGLEFKGFFRWFLDPNEHYCDPIADIIKTCIWYNPMEFYDRKIVASSECKHPEETHLALGNGPPPAPETRSLVKEKVSKKCKKPPSRSGN